MGSTYQRDFFKSQAIVAGAAAVLFSERWIGKPGHIFGLGAEVQDLNLWSATTFQVKINGVPVLDYGTIQDRIGSVDLLTPVDIYLPPYALIEMTAANGSGSDSVFIGRLKCELLDDAGVAA